METLKYEDIKIFKDNVSSFKDTSRDSDGEAPKYMTNSEIRVINFDKVKESYIREMNLSDTPCSSDSLELYDDYMSVVDAMDKKPVEEQNVNYYNNEKCWNRSR